MKIYFSFISRIKTYLKTILIIIKRRTYFHRNTTKNILKKIIFKIKPHQ